MASGARQHLLVFLEAQNLTPCSSSCCCDPQGSGKFWALASSSVINDAQCFCTKMKLKSVQFSCVTETW